MKATKHALTSLDIGFAVVGLLICISFLVYAYVSDTQIPGAALGLGISHMVTNIGSIVGRTRATKEVYWRFKKKEKVDQ